MKVASRLVLVLLSLAAAPGVGFSAADPRAFVRVGRTAAVPGTSDGRHEFGWETASAFCGLRAANLPGAPFVGKDAAWYLAYNRQALFVQCMMLLKPHGENYRAQATEDNNPALFDDDHLVIQVALDPRVGEAGVPYLRVAVNPNGAVWAETVEALPGQNHPLDTRRIARGRSLGPGHIPSYSWIARLRIPLDMLGVDSLDGRTGKVHLAWSTRPLYLSWGGVTASQWADMPEVVFDPAPTAVFGLNKSFPAWFAPGGGLHLDFSGQSRCGTAEAPLTLRLAMRNEAGGSIVWRKTWEAEKAAGQLVKFMGRDTVTATPGVTNRLTVECSAKVDGREQPLFRNVLPYVPNDPAAATALREWAAVHEETVRARANFDMVYDPYTDRLDALVSTALSPELYAGAELEKARAIIAAERVRASAVDAGGRLLATGEGAISNGAGHVVLQLPSPLPEGRYTVRMELPAGDQATDRAELPLVRERFEWEHSALGRDRVIIPPWTEVGVSRVRGLGFREEGSRLTPDTLNPRSSSLGESSSLPAVTCWGRSYALQNNGLPAAMLSQGEDVLGGPMRLDGSVDGKAVAATGKKAARVRLVSGTKFPAAFAQYELSTNACPVAGRDFKLETVRGYAAEIEADSQLGPVSVGVQGRLDYDGLYTVRLTLTPRAPVRLDALTLTVPLARSANLYRFSRTTDMACLGAIPSLRQDSGQAGDGVLAKSSDLPAHPALSGSFAPVVFAGQYDHGLFWMAESDRGWSVDDADDQVRLVREKGETALQFRFVARPTMLDRPRTLEFALIATPSRPKAAGYRQAFWEGKRTHDTAGFRYYGGGVNGFQLYEPADYEGLRRFLYESDGIAPQYRDSGDAPPGHATYHKVKNAMAKAGYPVTLYGCSWGANAGMREFPTFGSAWTHTARTMETRRVCAEFRNWYGFGGTVKWTTPAQLTPVYTLMNDSFVDCWLWHMVRLGQYSGVNGCFFDCFESLPVALRGKVKTDVDGVAYRREDGQLRPFANPLRYHRRTRRYATALWLIGRPPSLLQSNNFDNNYGPTWYVEGPMYHRDVGVDLIAQGVTPERAAAYTASCSGMGFCRSDVRVADERRLADAEEQCFAVLCAYGILHDLPWSGTPSWRSRTVKAVGDALKDLSIGDPQVRHVRYWNAEDARLIGVSDPRVLAGGFVHPEKKCAVVAVLNPANEAVEVDVNLGEGLLGGAVGGMRDLLAGTDLVAGPRAHLTLEPRGVKIVGVKRGTSD